MHEYEMFNGEHFATFNNDIVNRLQYKKCVSPIAGLTHRICATYFVVFIIAFSLKMQPILALFCHFRFAVF